MARPSAGSSPTRRTSDRSGYHGTFVSSEALPTTATAKILVRQLRAEGIECEDPVWEPVAKDPLLYVSRDDILSPR